ncbi:MAG: PEP-CTERM sorting domain-containing protein [Betaproteobacteria bacterium]|nr:PEP-CTERM sorting domain-containing protein [Betaproteobacteria bacterium]
MNRLKQDRRGQGTRSCRTPGRLAGIIAIAALAWAGSPALAHSVTASYFTFTDNGSYIDGGVDSSISRTRAVVDSGFAHTPLQIGGQQTDWTWQGKASASLNTGSLRTYAFSDTTDSHASEESPAADHGWRTQTTAALSDSVVFSAAPGASSGAPVAVTFRLDVEGSFAGSFATMWSSTFLMVNGVKSQVEFSWDGRLGPNGSTDAMATATGTVTGLSTDPHQLHALLSVTAMAIPGSPIVLTGNATARAAAGPFASVTADFDHTATLSIEAPAGYVFTSQSGVLLTTPVPEPSSWWLLATGLIVLAAVRWRRQFLAWRDPGRPWVAMPRKHAGESESVRDRRYGKPIPGRLHPSCLVSKVTCLSETSTACERRSPRARSAARTAIAVLSSLVLVMPYALATTDNSLPLSQGTFACAGKADSGETRAIGTNEISYIDGGKAFCYGIGSSFGDDPFVNASATATGGTDFPIQIQVNVSTDYYYRAQKTREPPFVPNILPEKFELKGKVETGMPWPDSLSAFVSAYANRDGHPQILLGQLRGNGTLNKKASIGAGHLEIVHVQYRAQCRVVGDAGQTVKCNARLDPLPEFDQEAFDLTNALAGRPTFLLDDYYTLEFSPNMVPEPETWLGLVTGLPLIALTIRGRKKMDRKRTPRNVRCGRWIRRIAVLASE